MTDGYYCNLCNKYFHKKSKNRHIKSFHSNSNGNGNGNSNGNSNSNIIPNLYYETELNYLKKRNQDLESIIAKFNIETNKFITDYRNKINLHYDEIIENLKSCVLNQDVEIEKQGQQQQQQQQQQQFQPDLDSPDLEINTIKMEEEEEEFNPVHKINKITFNHHINLPRCFRMLIIGSSGSGKTNLLLRMLLTDGFLDYDNLIIFSKTLNQPEYQYILHGFENNLSKKSIRYIFNNQETLFDEDTSMLNAEPRSIEEVIEQYALNNPEDTSINVQFYNNVDQVMPPEQLPKNKKNLIIFNDCINEKNQNIMENYFTRGRHSNTNVIYLSQSWFDLDKRSIRGNSNYIILFKLNKRDKSLLHSDLLSNTINKEEFDDLTKVWNQKYKYLAFNTEGEMKIRDNVFKY